MAAPSLSGSAFHRRRSLRGGAYTLGGTVTLKENDYPLPPKLPTPPLPSPATPASILRSHNGAPTARELFTTPRTPAHAPPGRLGARRAMRRGAISPAPQHALPMHPDVHIPRLLRGSIAGAGAGMLATIAAAAFHRIVLRVPGPGGAMAVLARMAAMLGSGAIAYLVLYASEPVTGAEHPHVGRAWSLRALRLVTGQRNRILHVILSIGLSVIHVLLTAAAVGFLPLGASFSGRIMSDLHYFTYIAVFTGAIFSLFAQASGVFAWRFSPTRSTLLTRIRQELPHVLHLSGGVAAAGGAAAWSTLMLLRRGAIALGALSSESNVFTGSLGMRAVAAVVAFSTLLSWSASLATYRLVLTAPLSVREHVPDTLPAPLQLKASQERARAAIERLLVDLTPAHETSGIGSLSRLLALQFFRDAARASRAARRVIFTDASGVTWNALLIGCLAPVDALSTRLAAQAPAPVAVQAATGVRARRGGAAAAAEGVGEGRAAAWGVETLSHMLVASRDEDDYGVAQRTFVQVVMSLLILKEQLDAARERARIVQPVIHWRGGAQQGPIEAILAYAPPQDKYFAPDVVMRLVADALDLALHRLVDAFRAHLKGYLVGAEPHWDRRLDRALKDALYLDGM